MSTKMGAVLHLTVLICYLEMVIDAKVPYHKAPSFNLDPSKSESQTCTAPNNKTGICVDNSICNEEHTILPGGDIDESDYRIGNKECKEQSDWCCTSDIIPPPEIGSSNSDKCFSPKSDVCPWCVLLYNAVDEKQRAVHPFCLGALIGSRVIITASTCLSTARKKLLYAQVPNSANPDNNYTVIRRQFHPNYNSGSHEYDFGIVVINGDVKFDKEKARGACVNFQDRFEGLCMGYGFNNAKFVSTLVDVKKNSCGKNGSAKDAACGRNADQVCIVAPGSPVLCPNKDMALLLFGIARGICDNDDNVLLGGISHSKTWIEKELSSMKIPKDVYSLGH